MTTSIPDQGALSSLPTAHVRGSQFRFLFNSSRPMRQSFRRYIYS